MNNIPSHYGRLTNKAAHVNHQGLQSTFHLHQTEVKGDEYKLKSLEDLSLKELISNKLLKALPDHDFVQLVPHLEPISLSLGEDLYRAEAPSRFVYFPENSVVSCLSGLQDGSTAEVCMIGNDGVVGLSALFDSHTPTLLTQTTIAGNALRMKLDIFKREFERGGRVQQIILSYTNRYITQISQRAVCNIHHKVEERLVNWLLMVHDRLETDEMHFTQELIAHHLGVRRAGVTTAARALQDEGIIEYSRGLIRLVNRQALESHACECYAMLKVN